MSELNWRRPLALSIILFVLGGFAYWQEYKHKPEQEEQQDQSKKFLAIEKSQVHLLRVSSDRHEITLECTDFANKLCRPGDNSKWQLVDPIKVKADDNNSNSLVSTINNLVASDTISLKEETPEKRLALLKEYGLDPASLSKDRQLEIDTASGTNVLYLGQTHPIGDGIFAAVEHLGAGQKPTGKIDDSQVFVVPSYFKASFERDLTYWRDKKVIPIAAHEIEGFTLKNSKGEIQGQRKEGMWTLRSKGDEVTGDIEAMDTLLSGVTYLTAKTFASDDKTDRRAHAVLAGARKVITLSLKKEKEDQPVVLTLYQKLDGKPAKGVEHHRIFATVSNLDPVFELESFAKERLEKTLQDLRLAKLITSMDRFSAKRLELSGGSYGAKPLVLLNKDSAWVVDGDAKQAMDAEKIQNFLDHLTAAKIQLFVTKDLPKPPASALQFTLGDDTQPQKRKLLFWRDVGKLGQKLYAKDLLSHRKEVFLMDNSLSNELPWEKAKLEPAKK